MDRARSRLAPSYFVALAILAMLMGCGTEPRPLPKPQSDHYAESLAAIAAHLGTIAKHVESIDKKSTGRRLIIGSEAPDATPAKAVDLRGALKSGFEMIIHLGHSKEEVTAFIQDRFSAIYEKRITLPPITKGAIKQKFRDDIRDDINQLLQ